MSIARNTAVILLGPATTIVVTAVTVPAYLHMIGQERYGVLAIVWSILTMFGMVEMASGALIQRFASSQSDRQDRVNYYLAALAINLAMGLAIGALVWLFFGFIVGKMSYSDRSVQGELLTAGLIVSAFLPVMAVRSVNTGVLIGAERFQASTALNSAETILSSLLPLAIAAYATSDIFWLLVGILGVRVLFVATSLIVIRPDLDGLREGKWRWSFMRSMLSFGLWAAMISILGSVLTVVDRFVLGNIAGVQYVPYYTVPQNICQQVAHVPRSLSAVLFPRFSAMSDHEAKITLGTRAMEAASIMMTPIVVGAILLIEPILKFWISGDFAAHATTTAQLLFFGIWFMSLARVPSTILFGNAKPDLVAKAFLIELLPYVAMLYLLVGAYGVAGAALAYVARSLADLVLLGVFSRLWRATAGQLAWAVPQLVCALAIAAVLSGILMFLVALRTALYMPVGTARIISHLPYLRRIPLGVLATGYAGAGAQNES